MRRALQFLNPSGAGWIELQAKIDKHTSEIQAHPLYEAYRRLPKDEDGKLKIDVAKETVDELHPSPPDLPF